MSYAGLFFTMTPNRKIPKFLPFLILAFVGYSGYRIWPGSPGAPPGIIVFSGPTMGTTYQVKLVDVALSHTQRAALQASVNAELTSINKAMSTYLEDSELSRLNSNPTTKPVQLSEKTFEVLSLAQKISHDSAGAFDVTVGPLVNAWGFGPTPRRNLSKGELSGLRDRVGYKMLALNPEKRTVTKTRGDLSIDLSAVAKGYAVDRIGMLVKKAGYHNHMIEIGGEITVSGINPERSPWRLAIEKPDHQQRQIHEVIQLSNGALATSGDYRNFVEIKGQRYSHTIDPRTGAPVYHQLASVSVIAKDCATADGYATALNVLGETAGFDLATSLNLAAFFIIREPDGDFSNKMTPQFEEYRALQPPPQGK